MARKENKMKDWRIVEDYPHHNNKNPYVLIHLCEVDDTLYYGGWLCVIENDRWECCHCKRIVPEEMQDVAILARCYTGACKTGN